MIRVRPRLGWGVVGGTGLTGCISGFVMGSIPPTGVKQRAAPVYVDG
jgi:hypothetical protein